MNSPQCIPVYGSWEGGEEGILCECTAGLNVSAYWERTDR